MRRCKLLKVAIILTLTRKRSLVRIQSRLEGTLQESGIDRGNVPILSEGESLLGKSARDEYVNAPDKATLEHASANCTVEYKQDPNGANMQPWNLQFPCHISTLRSIYEKQGLFDKTTTPETGKRSLRLNSGEARSGDSISMFGTDEGVAAQESVLFGIPEVIRSHGIHAVFIVATSEEDSPFLTRFLHANNAGVRVVISGATRLFMRGSTAQFRGDMMVSGFPLPSAAVAIGPMLSFEAGGGPCRMSTVEMRKSSRVDAAERVMQNAALELKQCLCSAGLPCRTKAG